MIEEGNLLTTGKNSLSTDQRLTSGNLTDTQVCVELSITQPEYYLSRALIFPSMASIDKLKQHLFLMTFQLSYSPPFPDDLSTELLAIRIFTEI
jgi:hypothetical protein